MSIILAGYRGKMGLVANEALTKAGYNVIGVGSKDSLSDAIKDHQPHVIVDLTTPDVIESHIELGFEHNVPMVVGTTGLSTTKRQAYAEVASQKQLGIILAPNFSIGALLMMHCAQLAQYYYDDIQITEVHHPEKKDQPSGTALRTQALLEKPSTIHSRRQQGVLADQTVDFANQGERFSLVHHTADRRCFMPGLLFAVKEVQKLTGLVYGLEQLLFPQGVIRPETCF